MMNPLLVLLMPSFSATPPIAAQDDLPRAMSFGKQKSSVLQKLSSVAADERIHAISVVREERIREGAPQLIQLLKDDNPAVRAEAAFAIGALRVRNAGARLYQLMLNDPSPLVRANAMVALAELDYKGALNAILNNLDRSDIREQIAAIRALGKFGGPKAFNQLIRILRSGNSELRESVIEALGELGDRQVARYLFRYLDQGGSRINRAALVALTRLVPQQIQGRLPKLLESQDAELVKTALGCAADIGCPNCGSAITALIQTAPDPVAAQAADTAAYLNIQEAIAAIRARLHPRPNIQTRLSFLWALGRLGDIDVLPEVLDAIREPVPELRATALRILRILRPESLHPESLVNIQQDDPFVAAEAIRLSSEYGSRRWLESGLPDEGDELRLAAALEGLSWTHPFPAEALPRVREWVRHRNPWIRDAAVTLLGSQRDEASAAELAKALTDPDDRVRWSVTRALALIRHPETRGLLESVARNDSLPLVRAYALLGVCATSTPSQKWLLMAQQGFDSALSDGDYGMAYLHALCLLHAPDSRQAPFEQVFKLLESGFNSSRKNEYVDLLFLLSPPDAERWTQRLLASPLPRVRARAMVWKARYTPVQAGSIPQTTEKALEAAAPSQGASVTPPFRVDPPRSGCSCSAGTENRNETAVFLMMALLLLVHSRIRHRHGKP